MEWEKASPELGVALGDLLVGFRCHKRVMFGAPVYFINDNMFSGVKGNVVFLRLSAGDRKVIMDESDDVRPFEPRPNFFMKEYVEIPESQLVDHDFITKWLQVSYAYVSSLPAKPKKGNKRQ
jgi:TfoX/Sxy family transcriptional regulator of competence genes